MSEEFENTFTDNEKRKALRVQLESRAQFVRQQAAYVTDMEQELREAREELLQHMVTVSALEAALDEINKEEF